MRPSLKSYLRSFRRFLPQAVTQERVNTLQAELTLEATWNLNYIVLIVSSCAIATLGLIGNSTAVIIGAMLIAPLMLPLRGIAFAALEGEFPLFRKALWAILGGTLLAIALSGFLGWITPIPAFGSEFQARVRPNVVDLGIALAAGGISAFAKLRQEISDALAGTAIAVALMPPLCVVGLSLSKGLWPFAFGALLLYLTNLLGIILACMLVFIAAGYAQATHSVLWAVLSVILLSVPLGANFLELVQKSRLEDYIRSLLIRRTLTISQEDVTLTDTRIDWSREVPIVYLNIQAAIEITPKQVAEVEKFISREVGRELKFVFFISQGQTVTASRIHVNQIPNTVPIEPNQPFWQQFPPLPTPEVSPSFSPLPIPEVSPSLSPLSPPVDAIQKPPKDEE